MLPLLVTHFYSKCMINRSVAMYSPSFIDEVYAKATDEAANCVREFQKKLEAHFNVTIYFDRMKSTFG